MTCLGYGPNECDGTCAVSLTCAMCGELADLTDCPPHGELCAECETIILESEAAADFVCFDEVDAPEHVSLDDVQLDTDGNGYPLELDGE